MALAAGCLVLLVAACSQSASVAEQQAKRAATIKTIRQPLSAVVNGVPLLELAKHAIGAAEAYSVSMPVGVRAVITTQSVLNAQVHVSGGGTDSEYLVTLRGHFTRGYCGTAMPNSTTTTDPSSVPVSTMVLQLPIPLVSAATTGVAVGVGTPELAKLGEVFDLDPYIRSLARMPVPIGPLPG
jgi:hypothetical protein